MKQIKVKVKSNWKRTTNVKVTVFDLEGNILDVQEFHNILTTVGKNMQRDGLQGVVTDLKIKRLGIGGSAAAVDPAQTKLVSEFFRKAITSYTPGATGILVTITYIAPYEANTPKVEELGWFCGVLATDTKDSGIMISRILYPRQKTGLESWQVERTDTFTEVGE